MASPGKDNEPIAKWVEALAKPVGIMACNDVRGLHVLDACDRSSVPVPEEAAVLGVDNEEILGGLCNPPLSSVAPSGAHWLQSAGIT